MNRDAEYSASDDALDDAIREAMRVEADEHQLAHLEHYWRVQSQRESWRRKFRLAMASAAAAIAFVAAVVLVWHREKERESAQVIQDSPRKLVDSDSAKRPLTDDTKSIEPSPSAGRPPTAYERFVFVARAGVEVHPSLIAARIDDAIQRVASNADADPAQVLDSSGLKRADAEMLLLRRLPSAPADQQHAILRLLAGCGSPRSAPALARLARNESLRTEALARLEQIVGIGGLAQTIGNSSDANVRSALILRLLTADSQAGLLGYLSLVRNDATRAEALSVAKKRAPHSSRRVNRTARPRRRTRAGRRGADAGTRQRP